MLVLLVLLVYFGALVAIVIWRLWAHVVEISETGSRSAFRGREGTLYPKWT
jgi:hypothetical protein